MPVPDGLGVTDYRIVRAHKRTGVVHHHLRGHSTEVSEPAVDRLQPLRNLLILEGLDVRPPSLAECHHAEVHPHPLLCDLNGRLSEVALQLFAACGGSGSSDSV